MLHRLREVDPYANLFDRFAVQGDGIIWQSKSIGALLQKLVQVSKRVVSVQDAALQLWPGLAAKLTFE